MSWWGRSTASARVGRRLIFLKCCFFPAGYTDAARPTYATHGRSIGSQMARSRRCALRAEISGRIRRVSRAPDMGRESAALLRWSGRWWSMTQQRVPSASGSSRRQRARLRLHRRPRAATLTATTSRSTTGVDPFAGYGGTGRRRRFRPAPRLLRMGPGSTVECDGAPAVAHWFHSIADIACTRPFESVQAAANAPFANSSA